MVSASMRCDPAGEILGDLRLPGREEDAREEWERAGDRPGDLSTAGVGVPPFNLQKKNRHIVNARIAKFHKITFSTITLRFSKPSLLWL